MALLRRSVLFAALSFLSLLPAGNGSLAVNTDGSFSAGPYDDIDDVGWLQSGSFFAYQNGTKLSTDDGSLREGNNSYIYSGIDRLGNWQNLVVTLEGEGVVMEVEVRNYPVDNPNIYIFEQRFPRGLNGCRSGSANWTSTGFPTFLVHTPPANVSLAYLMFAGYMMGDRSKTFGSWQTGAPNLRGGLDGSGPLVLYDMHGGVMLLSPMDHMMAASVWLDQDGVLAWGVMGGVDTLPPGFSLRTLLYMDTHGVGQAFEGWGRVLRQWYGKTSDVVQYHQDQDITLTHLGYWTDNGAYYYYHTESKRDYSVTLRDVKRYALDQHLPYNYIQIDSWWYPKDSLKAVTTWDAMTDIFPAGLKALHNDLQLPVAAHNRYWSVNTTYAKENGGQFDFFLGKQLSLPTTQAFWDWLLQTSKQWGLVLYEQDWLNVQLLGTELLWSNITAGADWLDSMARAARDNDMKIQYCMSQSRHALHSLHWPEVTQVRVTDDYHLYRENWKIGVTSHFAAAVGLAPSKDTFWSSSVQPGNTYNLIEPMPELQSAVATLSTGPVGPGDAINYTDRQNVMRCCAADGLILKPSRPATAIDAMFLEMGFGEGAGTSGEVWSTYSDFGDYMRFGIIFTSNVTRPFNVTPSIAGISNIIPQFPPSVLISRDSPHIVHEFSESAPFDLTSSTCHTDVAPYFCLFYTSPVLNVSGTMLTILGELAKWVPMSTRRVLSLTVTQTAVELTLRGKPGEAVTISFTVDGQLHNVTVTADINSCGHVTITPTTYTTTSHTPPAHTSSSQPFTTVPLNSSTWTSDVTTDHSSATSSSPHSSSRPGAGKIRVVRRTYRSASPASCAFSPPSFTTRSSEQTTTSAMTTSTTSSEATGTSTLPTNTTSPGAANAHRFTPSVLLTAAVITRLL